MKCQGYIAFGIMLICASTFAGERGFFGFSVSVDMDGFINPTLKSAKIGKVVPDSPADRAGLKEGDVIVEVEGMAVAGAKAKEIQGFMRRDAGEQTRFLIKRVDGQMVTVSLTAASKGN